MLELLCGYSDYALKTTQVFGPWLAEQWQAGTAKGPLDWPAFVAAQCMEVGPDAVKDASEEQQMAWLRQLRHKLLLLIMWRDFSTADDVSETLAALSVVAETLITIATDLAQHRLSQRFGSPCDSAGQVQSLVVLGMGKLGGRELNFSSDVDLIFAFARVGVTNGAKSLTNEEYFARAVRKIVRLLDTVTEQGFVYRVDLRLRPFGDAGRLALSFSAMEQYYLLEGRDWERYALLKARPVAGDLTRGSELMASLRPFVYRRYLDFGAFEALRQMKALIKESGKERDQNIKLGAGGIREIEFLTQAFQLVRGGRLADLRQVSLLPALAALSDHGLLSDGETDDLSQAYRFFRLVENRLQQKDDQQTHHLPQTTDQLSELAKVCGFSDAVDFSRTLKHWRGIVTTIFNQTFAPARETPEDRSEWKAWNLLDQESLLPAALGDLHFVDPAEAATLLKQFSKRPALRNAGAKGRGIIDDLLPKLIKQVSNAGGQTQVLRDVLAIIAAIAQRTAYLALLAERPAVMERVVWVCCRSEWLGKRLQLQPGLLDDLIAPVARLAPESLKHQLERSIGFADGDMEQTLMALCETQRREMVGLAIAFLSGNRDALYVGQALTDLAQGLLEQVITLARKELESRHGCPTDVDIAAIGYGTFGSAEMRYDSDLDLVFLTDGGTDSDMTNGPRSVPVRQFFIRLVQRVLSLLTLRTPFGRLYEVDTRLRPNGNAGFLVSSLDAYEKYQRDSAWVWERQALVRARRVYGGPAVSDRFAEIRQQVLTHQGDSCTLRSEICDMRLKMQRETRGAADRFKFRPGARLDIEFLAQFLCMAYSGEHEALAQAAGTPELLKVAARCELLSGEQRGVLVDGYASSVDSELRISLGAGLPKQAGEFEPEVSRVWREIMQDG
ncbi:MAG: bifunctional [glutamate--ammonia ligase]-adenylyl-L-tyrosine phosphorylase/[glutamate--ammonia-ligase] adenylyltransferase [Lysobacterales bacterium]